MAASTLTERDREEARSVTTHGSGHQFEIQLGHLCNNRCVFCSSGQLTQLKLARHIRLDPILEAIERAHAGGARRITFLGGEPTLHKGFPQALERAVELGFEDIVIFTNGVLLPHPGFVDRICALGSFEWRISIQGGNEDAHVAVTGRRDSFRRIVDGLVLLKARGQRVTTNMCVNERSYRSLPDYPALILAHDIRQLHVDIVRPESTGERDEAYLRDLMPRYSDMAPYLDRMLDELDRTMPGFDVNVGNLPYCVLPRWAHVIHHGGDETITQSCDEGSLEVAVDKYEWHASLRRHVDACGECALRPQCTGVFSTYLELHGDSEFRPITIEELLALDPARRHFVLYAERWLAPLYAAMEGDAPAGWSWRGVVRERHHGYVEVALESARARVTLRFGADATDAALVTDRYAMGLRVEGLVDASQLAALVREVRALLEQGGTTVLHAMSEDELARIAQRAMLLSRGAARLDELADRIERRGRVGAFRYAGRRAAERSLSVELTSPEGATIEALLSFELAGDRIKPSLDFALGEGTSEAAESAALEIIELLRSSPRPATAG